jgi:hypothetical protein
MATTLPPLFEDKDWICINSIKQFNKNNLVVEKSIANKNYPTCISSRICYKSAKDNKLKKFCVFSPTQLCWFGLSPTYPFGTKPEDKTPEKISGYQISYPLFPFRDDERNQDHEDNKQLIDLIRECAVESARNSATSGILDAVALKIRSRLQKDPEDEMKFMYSYPKQRTQDGKILETLDLTKPPTMYIDLLTFKTKNGNFKCETKFFDKTDEEHNPLDYVSVKMIIEPCGYISHINWAGPSGASIKTKLRQANFEIAETSHVRMIPRMKIENSEDQQFSEEMSTSLSEEVKSEDKDFLDEASVSTDPEPETLKKKKTTGRKQK